jgi:tRNA (guanine26-N2/guanine27-N2)-dimethyltransferase
LLDSAVQSVAEGGLLMVTATDMAVLCGNTAETCFTKYGSYALHREYCHEQALRIVLAAVAQHAARHKRVVEPVLSLSIDFYVRMFLRVRTSPADVKFTASRLSHVWQSTGCDSWWMQPLGTASPKGSSDTKFAIGRGPAVPPQCPISGGKFLLGGPMWNGPLCQPEAVERIFAQIEVRQRPLSVDAQVCRRARKVQAALARSSLCSFPGLVAHQPATRHSGSQQYNGLASVVQCNKEQYPSHAKLLGLLRAAREELPDTPLYYTISGLCRTVKCTSPKMNVLHAAIVGAGYRASATHCNCEGIKTDAPPEVRPDVLAAVAMDMCAHADKPVQVV